MTSEAEVDVTLFPELATLMLPGLALAGIKPHDRPIRDTPFLLAVLLGIMGAERTIRRRPGLA